MNFTHSSTVFVVFTYPCTGLWIGVNTLSSPMNSAERTICIWNCAGISSCTGKGRRKIGRLLAGGGGRIKKGSNWSQNGYSTRLEAIRLWWGSRSQELLPQFSTLAGRLKAMVSVLERDFGQYMSEEDGNVYIFASLIITQSLNNIFLRRLLSRNAPNTFLCFCCT